MDGTILTANHPSINRRRFERLALQPMYTALTLCRLDNQRVLEGHSYDISEGGLQFELDEPVEAGTPVAIEVALPRAGRRPTTIEVLGNIVWTDESEPGPVRMAVEIKSFALPEDLESLRLYVGGSRQAKAA
jgi:hypothetical protein